SFHSVLRARAAVSKTLGLIRKPGTGRRFNVPQDWSRRRILLHFGAVDYRATVWVNGRFVGEHEGGHTPFRFDITSALRPGPNTLTLRVEDPPSDRYIP